MGDRLNLAVVVQRYGDGVVGGSEEHCRAIAERLAERHRVTVLTSRARDYVTWKPEFRPGRKREGPVVVHRFRNRRRKRSRWFEINEMMLSEDILPDEEVEWFRQNGPWAPGLIEFLQEHGSEFDLVLFWTYRYAPSFFGLPLVADRSILVPTAEDDPAIRLAALRRFFSLPKGYLFLTPEEKDLVSSRTGGDLAPYEIIGSGLEPCAEASDVSSSVLAELGLNQPFALYLGRVDANKGCASMFWNYLRYADSTTTPIPLVVAGKAVMEIPYSPSLHGVGYVSDEEREALLRAAHLLIMPSPYESLSIALLEAWNHGRPALVNGRCKVLKGQVVRANGGLYYENREEFVETLTFLEKHPEISERLGSQGLEYVEQNYRWPVVMQKIEDFLQRMASLG
ncbi:MAG: glycosyltransferase family 4 protein [Acidobacteriota bacterium]